MRLKHIFVAAVFYCTSAGLFSYGKVNQRVSVRINTKNAVHTRKGDQHSYLCATLDWWPRNKCDSEDGQSDCAWIHASINDAPISGRRLQNALNAIGNFTLRLGGTLADTVVYAVGKDKDLPCQEFEPPPPTKARLFSDGCLSSQRWSELKEFCKLENGCRMVFGLNAMTGRTCVNVDPTRAPCFYKNAQCDSNWDFSNVEAFIQSNAIEGYPIFAYELGNELTCLRPEQYAESVHQLFNITKTAYTDVSNGSIDPSSIIVPKLIATDAVDGDPVFPARFLDRVQDVLYAYSWHAYPLGPGVDCTGPQQPENSAAVDSQIMDPHGMDQFIQTAATLSKVVKDTVKATTATNRSINNVLVHASNRPIPQVELWMGETGGAYDSGCNGSTNTFMSGFWYLNAMGGFAAQGRHDAFCRQTFTGGNYEWINKVTGVPNPDYYAAVLFNRLMGSTVLDVRTSTSTSTSTTAAAAAAAAVTTGTHAKVKVGGNSAAAGGGIGGGIGDGIGDGYDDRDAGSRRAEQVFSPLLLDSLRVYAHCSPSTISPSLPHPSAGSVSILYLNYANREVDLELPGDFVFSTAEKSEKGPSLKKENEEKEENKEEEMKEKQTMRVLKYILTGVSVPYAADALHSDVVALNGEVLRPIGEEGFVPDMRPLLEVVLPDVSVEGKSSRIVTIPAYSYGYLVLPDADAAAC